MRSSTYFSRALVRSVRSPCAMNARMMALQTRTASSGAHDHAGVAGEVAMAGDAAETEPEIHAGRDAEPVRHRTAASAMSLVSSSTATRPPPSKAMLNLRGRP